MYFSTQNTFTGGTHNSTVPLNQSFRRIEVDRVTVLDVQLRYESCIRVLFAINLPCMHNGFCLIFWVFNYNLSSAGNSLVLV